MRCLAPTSPEQRDVRRRDAAQSVHGIMADGLAVKHDVFLSRGFIANGEVRQLRAQIGGDLVCDAGSFMNEDGRALSADGAVIKGSVFLTKGSTAQWTGTPFTAKGEVNLNLAQIDGRLDCRGGVFSNPRGDSLSAERAVVKSSVLLSDGFRADGKVYLSGAQIGGDFICDRGSFQDATLDLTDASAATLYDSGLNDPVDHSQTRGRRQRTRRR
jgi:hypothetical protein